jgi:type IV pilus assembly protein PilC
MDYVCKVGTPAGEVVERTFSAADEAALRAELYQQGYYLFGITRGAGLSGFSLRKARVAPSLVLIFAQELAALLKAGLPLLQSLDIMLERQRDPVFRRSLGNVRDKVKGGTALSAAFKAEAELYPPIFSASLVAGERSGALEGVLRRFAQHLRLNESLKKKAVSASVYPLVLIATMLVMVVVLLVFVIPQFQSFYEGLGAELPLPTRILLAIATTVKENILWILLAVAGVVVTFLLWRQRAGSAIVIDRALLRLPYFGGLIRMYATSQLMRTLSTLLAGGLPLLSSLETSSASIGNRAMGTAVAGCTHRIREGASLTTALESTGMFEALPLEMVKVGEQTGALADMLNAVAEFYDEDLDIRIATVLSLVEPVLLVMMAIVVAGMLLAFYLPMFEAISTIQSKIH